MTPHSEEKNKIHINPDFLGVCGNAKEVVNVHFNPVFFNKSYNTQNHQQSHTIPNYNPSTLQPLVKKPPLPPLSKPSPCPKPQLHPPFHPQLPSPLFSQPPKPAPKPIVQLKHHQTSNQWQSFSLQTNNSTNKLPHQNYTTYHKNPHVFCKDESKSISATASRSPYVNDKLNYKSTNYLSSNNTKIMNDHTTFSSQTNDYKIRQSSLVSRSKSLGENPGISAYKWTKSAISAHNNTETRKLINKNSPKVATSIQTVSSQKKNGTNIIGSKSFHEINDHKICHQINTENKWTNSYSLKSDASKNPYKIDNTKSNSIKGIYPKNLNEAKLPYVYKINDANKESNAIAKEIETINLAMVNNTNMNKFVPKSMETSPKKSVLVQPNFQYVTPNKSTLNEVKISQTEQSALPSSNSTANSYKVVTRNRIITIPLNTRVVKNNDLKTRFSIVNSTPSKKLGKSLSVHRPSPKFPKRARTYSVTTVPRRTRTQSEMSTLGKSYTVITKTKLIRRLSNNLESENGKGKYSVKTRTKLVRQKSDENKLGAEISTSKNVCSKPHKSIAKYKTISRSGTKCSLLSRTKLVRRSSYSSSPKLVKCLKTSRKACKFSRNNVTITGNKVRSYTSRNANNPIGINSKYKIVKNLKLSPKQRAASNIISKYKINNIPSPKTKTKSKSLSSKYKANPMKIDRRKGLLPTRESKLPSKYLQRKIPKKSDHIINIGGILYKSTRNSLKKQVAKKTVAKSDEAGTPCIVHVRGDQFYLGSSGRTLKRIASSTTKSVPRVHIGGLTYSQTNSGQYELTQNHQARAVLNSARNKSLSVLSQRRKKKCLKKRNEYCMFYNRFGRCAKKDKGQCLFIHDPEKVAVCTRFLRGRCPVDNCPFSHKVDPDKMPVCSHFLRAACSRENCPYRHVRVNPKAPVCKDFLKGFCPSGQKNHILNC
ncbi:unnamed protein product, partial [Meganyctiphanes norvegica]